VKKVTNRRQKESIFKYHDLQENADAIF